MSNNNSHFSPSLINLIEHFEKQKINTNFNEFIEEDFLSVIRYFKERDEVTKAIRCCDISLEYFPGNIEMQLEKAILLYEDFQFDQSFDLLESLLVYQPFNADVLVAYATALGKTGDIDQSLDYFSRAERFANGNLGKIISNKINILFENGLYREAIKTFDENLEILSFSELAVRDYMYSSEHIGKVDESINNLLKNAKEYSDSFDAWALLGYAYFAINDHESALDTFNVAISLKPNAYHIHYLLGQQYFEMGIFSEALEHFVICKKKDFKHPKLNYYIGLTYGSMELLEKACDFLESEIQLYPNDSLSWYALGITQEKMDLNEKAIKSFKKAIKLNSFNELFWFNLALLYIKLKDRQSAIDAFVNCLDIEIFNEKSWLYYLQFLANEVDLDTAINVFSDSDYVFFENSRFNYLLGALYFRANNIKSGIDAISQAHKMTLNEMQDNGYRSIIGKPGVAALFKNTLN